MNNIKEFFLSNNPSRVLYAKKAYDDVIWKVDQIQNRSFSSGKGNLHEYLINVKYNADRASKGQSYMNIVTDLPKERGGFGEPTAVDDLRIYGKSYQAKTHDNIDVYFKDLSDEKYNKIDFLIPSDQYKAFQERAYYKYKTGSLSRKEYLDYTKRVHKSGVTMSEIYKYQYQDYDVTKEVQRALNREFLYECQTTVLTTTLAHSITKCAISSTKNIKDYLDGKIKKEECLKNIFNDTAKSAGKGFAVGSLANVFNFIGYSVASGNILQNGAVSLTLANGIFDLGATYKEYLSGNIDGANFFEQIITKSIISAATLIARVAIIKNPIMSTIVACVVNSIFNELLIGSSECICEGNALLYNEELAKSIERENTLVLNKLSSIINKRSENYKEVCTYLQDIAKSNDVDFIKDSLIIMSQKLNLNIEFESIDEFKKKINSGKKIII